MEISSEPSKKPLPRVDKIGAIIFFIIGIIGFLDAAYLSLEYFRGQAPICIVGEDCKTVLSSTYATIGPVPLAFMGVLYYLGVIAGVILFFDLKNIRILHLLAAYTMIGLFASIYFVYLMFFVIKALCTYCLVSAGTSTMLFLNGAYIYKKTTPIENEEESV